MVAEAAVERLADGLVQLLESAFLVDIENTLAELARRERQGQAHAVRLQRERVGRAGLGKTGRLAAGEAEVISDISVRVTLDLCGAHLRGTRRFAPISA